MLIKKIYIIDDEVGITALLTEFAKLHNIQANFANAWGEVSILELKQADLLILDLDMPDVDGLDILELLNLENVRIPVIFCSGHDKNVVDTAVDLLKENGLNYGGKLAKPFSIEQFSNLLRSFKEQNIEPHKPVQANLCSLTNKETVNKKTLEDAIDKGWFNVAFQSQLTAKDKQLCGIECLARLSPPGMKPIAPDVFIPAIVEHGLMDSFTLYILSSGLSTLGELNLPEHIKIAFNLSTTSLNDNFLRQLYKCCSPTRFKANQIVWEITETAALDISQYTKKLMTKLRLQGFSLSLDDFGTGYSTIQELDALPFNEIKIDKLFVHSMHDKATSMAIVSATIDLAKNLNCRVIGEGVETEQQANTLSSLNCDVLQGYFFSRPLSGEDFAAYLQQFDYNALYKL